MTSHSTPVHISVILDRSGSMAGIASDIAGGFNTFLDEQRAQPGGGRMTLVQFDGQDPFEVLIDGDDLATVSPLDPARYLPRGSTPLNDAVGRMIARIDQTILSRADDGLPIEDQIVLIITDGFENASREFDGQTIGRLIEERRARGWVFSFLGSDESTFREGAAMRIAGANTATWEKSGEGSREMFGRLSAASSRYRSMTPEQKRETTDEFLEDDDKGQ